METNNKLREALMLALSLLDLKEGVSYKTVSQKDLDFMKSALAEPPRNCDIVPIEAPKASDMFHRERPLHGYDYETHDWLLAPATEKKGGE